MYIYLYRDVYKCIVKSVNIKKNLKEDTISLNTLYYM